MLKFTLFFISFTIFAHSQNQLDLTYKNKGENYNPRTKHFINNKAQFTNHLINSNSPYLLQHAHNPVRWYEFGDEAFDLAKNKFFCL